MLNNVVLMGRLTKDPELRHTQSNIPVASFTIAVDRGYKKDEADFINIVAWRGTAEFVSKWITKGQLIAVSGKLQTRKYQDRDNFTRTATEVIADEVYFAGARSEAKAGENTAFPVAQSAPIVKADEPEFEEITLDNEPLPW